MENSENAVQPENSFMSNYEMKDYLTESAKWAKFLSIVGFITIGLLFAFALFFMFFFTPPDFGGIPYSGFVRGVQSIFFLIFALLYFFPTYYLYMFSVKTKQGIKTGNITILTLGFKNLKSMFKFVGIITLIILSIYAIILLFTVPFAVLSAL